MKGLLLFAHGARDPAWSQPFEAVLARVRALRPGVPVQLAFLEFMAPTMQEAGNALVAAGCEEVTVLPLFLGAGGHVRKDVPLWMATLQAAHPAVQFNLEETAGQQRGVIDALAQVAIDAL